MPLYDVTGLVPKNRIGDEGPLAQALADKMGNIDVTFCRAENISPLEGIELKMKIHDQPGFAPGNAYWIIDILTKCQNDNIGTLLIGQSGNATVSWPPRGLIDNSFYSYLLKQLLGYRQRLKFDIGVWQKDLIINKQLLKKCRIKKAIYDANWGPYFFSQLGLPDIRVQMVSPGKKAIGTLWHENGIFFKMEVRDPTLDLRLLNFLFGIPFKSSFYGNRKIFKAFFDSFFPENIINGKQKGIQAIDLTRRIEKEYQKLTFELLSNDINKHIFYQYVSSQKLKKILYHTNKTEINRILMAYSFSLLIKSLNT